MPNLILASKSPRREQLLRQIGVNDFLILPATEEIKPPPCPPLEYVVRLAQSKARDVAGRVGGNELILSADTVVAIDGRILEKPEDADEARAMLRTLSGRRHEVFTGVTLLRGEREESFCEVAGVYFCPLTQEDIETYIATGEPFDKAGSYGVQGLGARFVTRIEGDYSAVVGLPLSRVYDLLKAFGYPG